MKPEYDEAAEILNKGADVGFMTFCLCLHVYSMLLYRPVYFVYFFISHTLISIHSYTGVATPN